MRQAGEVTYAGMCQSIYQQFEFMSELVFNANYTLLALQTRTSRIATKGEYLKIHNLQRGSSFPPPCCAMLSM